MVQLVIARIAAALLLPCSVAYAHDIYTDWKKPGTAISCCSGSAVGGDCYPTEARFVDGHWQAKRREDGRWLDIPDDVVLKDFSTPEGDAHLCAPKPISEEDVRVYCFRPPFFGL